MQVLSLKMQFLALPLKALLLRFAETLRTRPETTEACESGSHRPPIEGLTVRGLSWLDTRFLNDHFARACGTRRTEASDARGDHQTPHHYKRDAAQR